MTNNNFKHDFEPTDNQGQEMECTECGRYISVHNEDESDWEKGLNEVCPEAIKQDKIYRMKREIQAVILKINVGVRDGELPEELMQAKDGLEQAENIMNKLLNISLDK